MERDLKDELLYSTCGDAEFGENQPKGRYLPPFVGLTMGTGGGNKIKGPEDNRKGGKTGKEVPVNRVTCRETTFRVIPREVG